MSVEAERAVLRFLLLELPGASESPVGIAISVNWLQHLKVEAVVAAD